MERQRFDFLEDRISGPITFHYNGHSVETSADSLPQLVEAWRSGFPDLEMRIRHLISEGNLVGVSLVLHGTHLGVWNELVRAVA